MDRACGFAAECGYTGIEIAPFTLAARAGDVSPAQREEIRRQAEAAGLEVVGLHWLLAKTEGFHLTSPDAAVRQRTADYLVDLALLCGDLGGRVMVLGSPVQRNLAEGVTKAQGMAYAAEVLCAGPSRAGIATAWCWPWSRWVPRKRTSCSPPPRPWN